MLESVWRPRSMACHVANDMKTIDRMPWKTRQVPYVIGRLLRMSDVTPRISIRDHANIPSRTPRLSKVVMIVINASIGSTPSLKIPGNDNKKGMDQQHETKIYPIALWSLENETHLYALTPLRLLRARKNCPSIRQNERKIESKAIPLSKCGGESHQ